MPVIQGFDDSNATVEAVAAPGAGKKIVYKRIKVNIDVADTVIVKSGSTEIDRYLMADNGGIVEDFGGNPDDWMHCAANQALNLTKQAATGLAYRITYAVREA